MTLEEWHAFGDMIQQEIERRVVLKLEEAGLPRDWATEMPYATCSIQDFEGLIQVLAKEGIAEVIRRRANSPEYRKWEIGSFLTHEFKDALSGVRPLFPEAMEELVRWL